MADEQQNSGAQAPVSPPNAEPRWDAASHVYSFSAMPKRANANGSESRSVLHGQLVTGENVRVHQTEQAEGLQPNPAHAIEHTEIVCVRKGVLEFSHNGTVERATAGDVILVAKGTVHQMRNAGPGPLSYFIVSIGGDVR